jgi:hypothetical protein
MTLRAVQHVVADDRRTARQRLGELWRILDQLPVNEALSKDRNSRATTIARR